MPSLNLPSTQPAGLCSRRAPAALCWLAALAAWGTAAGEGLQGRVFLPTPESVLIYEFNELPAAPGAPLFPGTVILDLSGSCLNAAVEGELIGAGAGDVCFNVPPREFNNPTFRNTTVQKTLDFPFNSFIAVDEAANADGGALEMDESQDFSIELYVRRDPSAGTANSGLLAGTWHSRNLIDDSGKEDEEGAWYGFGLMRLAGAPSPDGGVFPTGGWKWVLSPVIDGQPEIGLSAQAERFLDPAFEIPAGSHYVVLTIDRAAQLASGYVDGNLKTQRDLEPAWAFITPPGRDPARFLMLSGEDDRSRGAYRGAPTGYHIDAVRVQRRAMSPEEVQEAHLALRACRPHPAPALTAVITTAALEGVPGQCFRLSAASSIAGEGQLITRYEWKVGAGGFEAGDPARGVSFSAASPPEGIPVVLRITDDASESATAECRLHVVSPEPVAAIDLDVDGAPVLGDTVPARLGATLSFDGSRSATPATPGASDCQGKPVLPAAITAFAWDFNGDGAADSTADRPPSMVLSEVGVIEISLEVTNSAGRKGRAVRTVEVVDSGGNSIVFHPTPATIVALEFNDFPPEAVHADGTKFPDSAGGGLALTIREPGGEIVSAAGAPQFAGSRAAVYLGGDSGPRGVIEDDQNAFEFGPQDSFTFEIYAKPGESETPFWGDIAGTFRARTRDPDPESQPRYGWGIIKSHLKEGYMWFTAHGAPEETIVPFTLAKGIYSYVACAVDRTAQSSRVFVNGDLWSEVALDPSWDFRTPAGLQHASFLLFTREQKDGEYFNIPPGMAVEALRVQRRALTAAQIAANWGGIRSGLGADAPPPAPPPATPTDLVAAPGDGEVILDWDGNPPEAPPIDGYNLYRSTARGGPYARVNAALIAGRRYTDGGLQNGVELCYVVRAARGARESGDSNEACAIPASTTPPGFRRGDADANGTVEITDAVALLGFLFLGDERPPCFDAADADDNSALEITDAVFSLGYQFLGDSPPPAPGPLTCGPDPTPELSEVDYGCAYPEALCR